MSPAINLSGSRHISPPSAYIAAGDAASAATAADADLPALVAQKRDGSCVTPDCVRYALNRNEGYKGCHKCSPGCADSRHHGAYCCFVHGMKQASGGAK